MALDIDDETARLVGDLAEHLGMTEPDAVRAAVKAALQRLKENRSLKERLDAFRARHPRPKPTGVPADKAFYDDLSGALD